MQGTLCRANVDPPKAGELAHAPRREPCFLGDVSCLQPGHQCETGPQGSRFRMSGGKP